MKLTTIILLLIMISCQQILADESETVRFLHTYDKNTIYLHNNYFGKWYVKDAQILPIGRFGKNLAKEISASDFAMEEMIKAQSYAKIGTVTGFIAGTIGVTGTVLEILDVEYSHKREAYVSMIITSAVLGIISKAFNESSAGARNRAVWLYNRDIISGIIR